MRAEKKLHPVRFMLRRNAFLGLFEFIAAFLTLPFWTLSGIRDYTSSFRMIMQTTPAYTPESLKAAVSVWMQYLFYMSINLEAQMIMYGGMGFVAALVLFRHLFNRKYAMLNASLPVTRGRDWLHRCLSFLVLVCVPMLLAWLVHVALLFSSPMAPYISFGYQLRRMLICLIVVCYGFGIGTISAVLTGQFWAAILGAAVLGFSIEGTVLLWSRLAQCFLDSMPSVGWLSPIADCSPVYGLYKAVFEVSFSRCVPALVVTAVFIAVSWLLIRRRPTESAGRTLAFDRSETPLTLWLSLVGGTVCGFVGYFAFQSEKVFCLSLIAGVLAGYLLCRLLFTLHFRGMLRRLWIPAVCAVVLLCATVCLHNDVFGYDSWQPDPSAVTRVTIQPEGEGRYVFTEKDGIEAALAYTGILRDGSAAVPHGMRSRESASFVNVTYDVNGRTVSRRYRRWAAENVQSALTALVAAPDYAASVMENAHLDFFESILENNLSDGNSIAVTGLANYSRLLTNGATYQINISNDRDFTMALIAALRKDIPKRTLADLQTSSIYELNIYSYGSAGDANATISVYACDTEICAVLFGEDAKAVVDWLTYGSLSSSDGIVIRATYLKAPDHWFAVPDSAVQLTDPAELATRFRSCMSYRSYGWNSPVVNDLELIIVISRAALERLTDQEKLSLPQEGDPAAWLLESGLWNRLPFHSAWSVPAE